MKNVLITGAKGFLGQNMGKYLHELGYNVCGIGHGKVEIKDLKEYGLTRWIESEILLNKLVELKTKFDIIIHYAGSGSVGFSIKYPKDDFEKSVNSTLELLEYIRLYNKNALFVYPSSPAVQGAHIDTPIVEDFEGVPASPYGLHKKNAESLCWSYSNFYGIRVLILRYFSIYGEGLKKQLLWDAINKFDNNNFTFFGTGYETRDWVYIDDAVEMTYKLTIKESKEKYSIFNIGSGNKTTNSDILNLLRTLLKLECMIEFNGKTKKGDPRFYWADVQKLDQLKIRSKISLSNGLMKYINWYKQEIKK